MSQPGPVPAPGAGERWSVNMPAVIGVVFVFLVAVIVWVIATGGGGDGDAAAGATTTPPTAAPAALVTTTLPGATTTLSPTPLPATTIAPAATTIVSTTPQTSTTVVDTTTTEQPTTTAAPTTEPPETTAAPTTTPPDDDDGEAAAGDLGIAGTPMRSPSCNDDFITIIASAVGAQATADSVAAVLSSFPGSNYLRTDSTCPSLNPSVGGEPIYVVYFGPFGDDDDACDARSRGTSGSYVRVLSTSLGPDHSVTCG